MKSEHCRDARPSADEGLAPAAALSRPGHLLLGLVFLVALGVRVLHWWGQARSNPFFDAPIMDERMHHEWAQLVASGEGLGPRPFFRAPLYYYLVGGLYAVFGPSIAVARLLGCVLGAASCYLVARLGTVLDGVRVGVLAGILAALYWPLVHFDEQLLTVSVEIFLNLLMLWLLLAAGRFYGARGSEPRGRAGSPAGLGGPALLLLAGAVWGLSVVARPNVLAFGPGILVWLWVVLRAKHCSRAVAHSRVLLRFLIVCLGAAIAILPVTIRNRIVGGEWVLIASNGGVNFYIGNNPQADGIAAVVPGTRADWRGGYEDTHRIPREELGRELSEGEVSSYWLHKGLSWVASNPGAWIKLTLHKLGLFWSPHEIPNNQPIWFFASLSGSSGLYWLGFPPIAVLGVAGLAALRGRWRLWLLPLLFGAIYMGTVVLFFCPARYRLPVVPIMILLAAAGLTRLPGLWRARRVTALAGYGVLALLIAGVLAAQRPDAEWKRMEEGRAYHNLGAHFARLGEDDPSQRDKAIDYLTKAVALRPNDPFLHQSVGAWLGRFGRVDESGQYLARAVALRPDLVDARRAYGDWMYERGRLAEAAEQYEGIVALRPDMLEARRQLGRTLARMGRLAEAERHFVAILQQQPDAVLVLLDLALALERRRRPVEAAERYREVLRLVPENALAAEKLARLLFATGRAAEALDVLRESLRRSPDNADTLTNLAGLLVSTTDEELRDSAAAIRHGERALELGAGNLTLYDALSLAYADVGRYEDAIHATEQALDLARAAGRAALVEQLTARLARCRAARDARGDRR